MTIKSMTGFARVGRSDRAAQLALGGALGQRPRPRLRLRLPPGFEALEPRIREAVAKRIARGSLTVNLNVKRSDGETRIRLNEAALRQVLAALDSLEEHDRDGAAARRGAARHQGRARGGRAGGERGRERRRARRAMLAGLATGARRHGAGARGGGRAACKPIVLDQLAAIERLVARSRPRRRARPRPSASG